MANEAQTIAELRQQLEARNRDLAESLRRESATAGENEQLRRERDEALEREAATGEVLRMIARSPADLRAVMSAIAENAAQLCDAADAAVWRVDGDVLRLSTHVGPIPMLHAPGDTDPIDQNTTTGRAILERQTIHVHNLLEAQADFPRAKPRGLVTGTRTALAAPLLRDGEVIGAIHIRRTEIRPFTDRQIKLLETFADQAVIAIENVRLFKEIQERNAELREALEHQTATAEMLGIISRSPTDVQPVLDAIAESAARVCGVDDVTLRLRDGDVIVARAHFGPIPIGRPKISIDEPQYSWMREHGTLYIPDVRAQKDFPALGSAGDWRTYLTAPLRQQGELIGTLNARRTEVRAFTPTQIKLLETFTDQAVIAIENVRLFNELKESLEQQTATSEILGVIASSPTDIQPVLDVVAENAARVCGAHDAVIFRVNGDVLDRAAHYGPIFWAGSEESLLVSRGSVNGRAVVDRRTIHIHDMAAEAEAEFSEGLSFQRRSGHRTTLATPLLREGTPIGTIMIRRTEVRPFSDKQIKLLETFASQAVIAIENVRLFKELQERNRDLTEALEQQTATGEVLRVIASSPTELQPVLDTVITNAVRLIGAEHGHIRRYDGEFLQVAAYYNVGAEGMVAFQQRPLRPGRETGPGRSFLERRPIHIPDVESDPTFELPPVRFRTFLAVPMLREGIPIGTISIWRETVAPFTERQIQLVTTFADQAVIAIENVRLFQELQERNAELREALEHQTATSEVLGIISRSPTDVQPVLDAIVESAARVCGIDDVVLRLHERNQSVLRAHFGPVPDPRSAGSIDGPQFSWIREHGTLHIPDVRARPDFSGVGSTSGSRTFLFVPLRQQGDLIGELVARRMEVRPFSQAQIKLVETFADQAVIAIENVRLFQELQERTSELARSVGELKALGEVGQAVSSSLDLERVLATIVAHAVELSGTDCGVIYEYEEDTQEFHLRASHRMEEEVVDALRTAPIHLGEGATGQAATNRAPVQVPDILDQREYAGTRVRPMLTRLGYRRPANDGGFDWLAQAGGEL